MPVVSEGEQKPRKPGRRRLAWVSTLVTLALLATPFFVSVGQLVTLRIGSRLLIFGRLPFPVRPGLHNATFYVGKPGQRDAPACYVWNYGSGTFSYTMQWTVDWMRPQSPPGR